MSASVARVGQALRVGPGVAWLVALALLFGVAGLVAFATRRGDLPIALGVVLLGLVTVASFRWPLLPLVVFAVLIPIEEVVVIEGFGTLSRFAGILFAVTYGVPRIGRLALGAMPPAGWAFAAWVIISLGWAIDPAVTLGQVPTFIQLFLVALLVADFVVHRPGIVRPVLWAYSLSAAATALVGLAFFIGSESEVGARSVAIEGQDPNHFAAVLLPALVFGLYELVNGDRRILGAAIALVTTLGVVVSGSRGAWVAVAVVVLFVILPQLQTRRRIAMIAAALVLIVLAYQVPGVPDLLADRTGTAVSTGGAGRTNIWSVAGTIYRSAPVFGVGWANFPVAYTADAVRASDVSSWYWLQSSAPHSVVAAILVELGPIGLLLLVLFLGPLLLRRGWGPDAAVVQAALVSLLTIALFLDVVGNRKQVWLVIGLAAGLAYVRKRLSRPTPAAIAATAGSSCALSASELDALGNPAPSGAPATPVRAP